MTQHSLAGKWGCLAAGMIGFGAFFIFMFRGVGGTEYDLEYVSIGLIIAGFAIGLGVITKRLR